MSEQYESDRNRLKFVVLYNDKRIVKMGAKLQGHFYAQEFPRDTLLGDAIDVLRSHVVRLAGGLDPPAEPDEPPQQETF